MDINRLFNLYDNGRNGHLTADNLRQIANEYGIWV
jgi:Ca2+-binding EF-hand superfamily protein